MSDHDDLRVRDIMYVVFYPIALGKMVCLEWHISKSRRRFLVAYLLLAIAGATTLVLTAAFIITDYPSQVPWYYKLIIAIVLYILFLWQTNRVCQQEKML